MAKPEKTFKVGPVRASVFRNPIQQNGRSLLLPKVVIEVRYKRLKTSRRMGNNLKDTALREGLAEQVRVPTRSGIVVLLDLTVKSRSLLTDETVIQEIPPRRGGLVHEYWKNRIADELRAKGFRVEVEAPLKTGGTVDILVHTKEGPRAIEIETGKSDAKANVEKCLRAGIPVTLVATEREALQGILVRFHVHWNIHLILCGLRSVRPPFLGLYRGRQFDPDAVA
jgi:hypothetical protein